MSETACTWKHFLFNQKTFIDDFLEKIDVFQSFRKIDLNAVEKCFESPIKTEFMYRSQMELSSLQSNFHYLIFDQTHFQNGAYYEMSV